MEYSDGFKKRMVTRLAAGTSATALSREVGVPQPTLSTWLRKAHRVRGVTSAEEPPKSPEPAEEAPPRRPQDWTAEEKLHAVLEASALPEAELGAWLRRKGLHEAQLREWRAAAVQGLKAPAKAKPSSADKRIKVLEREVARKDKALAETAALLVLRKKLDALLVDEDDATGPKSDDTSSTSSKKR